MDNSSVVVAGTNATALQYNAIRNDLQTGWMKPQYLSGGVYLAEAPTYASSTTINIQSDGTERYSVGDMIRFKQGGAYKYFAVTVVASTLLTLVSRTSTVANLAITDFYVAVKSTPNGYEGVGGATPVGGSILWSGSVATIPSNWLLCNGSNGTPDLRDRFIVGAGTGGSYAVGATGGENTHVLTTAEMPSHTHSYTDKYTDGNRVSGTHAWSSATDKDPNYTTENKTTGSQGSDTAHENRPPYYALAYIMRVY